LPKEVTKNLAQLFFSGFKGLKKFTHITMHWK
jgi:hypothetical protein